VSILSYIGPSVGPLVRPLVRWLVCPHDEILRKLLMWKIGYVAIALRRGEGRENRFASRLVMVAHSCFTRYELYMVLVYISICCTFHTKTDAVSKTEISLVSPRQSLTSEIFVFETASAFECFGF
jgi:hypothetical protein